MKKIWLPLGIILVFLSFGSSAYLIITKINKPVVSPKMPQLSTNTISASVVDNFITLVDPTGFTIKYPVELTLNRHEEDKQNYAHLEFTNKDHAGSLIIWAKDTSSVDTQNWVKSEKRFVNANLIDTFLGGKKAKKVSITLPQKLLVTGLVDEKIIYTIETTLDDSGYWTQVHETISDNFIFSTPTYAPTNNNSAVDDNSQTEAEDNVFIDEEETIE